MEQCRKKTVNGIGYSADLGLVAPGSRVCDLGHRVIAPDGRGFGESSRPAADVRSPACPS